MNNLKGKPNMTTHAKVTFKIATRWPVQYAVIDFVKRLGPAA
jgi:uncharacterized protein (DUF362 family)